MPAKKHLFAIVLLLISVSCGLFRDKNPCEEYISRQTMVKIVADVFLLESYISSHASAASIRDSVPVYYANIFEKYGTDPVGFENAFRCYLLDRDQMNLLLDDVLSSLSIAQSRTPEFPGAVDEEDTDYFDYPHYY
jgi:hypothetical protein